jgi:hypothetical protein
MLRMLVDATQQRVLMLRDLAATLPSVANPEAIGSPANAVRAARPDGGGDESK